MTGKLKGDGVFNHKVHRGGNIVRICPQLVTLRGGLDEGGSLTKPLLDPRGRGITPVPQIRTWSKTPNEDGMVTAFVVLVTLALVLFIGLVLDGGYTLAARREAIDEADGAARAAAQAIHPLTRTSRSRAVLDPGEAQAAVDAYLSPTGHSGQVSVGGDSVTVTVSFPQQLYILGAGGLFSVTVSGRGTARAVRGIESAASP